MARSGREPDSLDADISRINQLLDLACEHVAIAQKCDEDNNKIDVISNVELAIYYYSTVCEYLQPGTHPFEECIGSLSILLHGIYIEEDPFSHDVYRCLNCAIKHLTQASTTPLRNYLLGLALLGSVNYFFEVVSDEPNERREALADLIEITMKAINYILDSKIDVREQRQDDSLYEYDEELGRAYYMLASLYEAKRDIKDIQEIRKIWEYHLQADWLLMFAHKSRQNPPSEPSTPSPTGPNMNGPLFQPE